MRAAPLAAHDFRELPGVPKRYHLPMGKAPALTSKERQELLSEIAAIRENPDAASINRLIELSDHHDGEVKLAAAALVLEAGFGPPPLADD